MARIPIVITKDVKKLTEDETANIMVNVENALKTSGYSIEYVKYSLGGWFIKIV